MSSIFLPTTHRRAALRGFWIVISLVIGLIIAVAIWGFNGPQPVGAGVLTAALLTSTVFAKEDFVWLLYEGWNRFLVQPFAGISRRLVTSLCYFIIFAAVGRAGAHFRKGGSRQGGSIWMKHDLQVPNALPAPATSDHRTSGQFQWIRYYLSWAGTSGNGWAITLLPFLLILRACSRPEAEQTIFDIYTLF